MVRKIVQIRNPEGLKARPAAMFVQSACRFQAQILIEMGNKKINAKSIMGVMMLAAGKGSKVLLETDGVDEEECMDALKKLINNKFGEAE